MNMNDLPPVPNAHIAAMEREAKKKMEADGVVEEPVSEISAETAPEAPEVPTSTPETPETVAAPVSSVNKEDNLRILRERSERAERERDELMRQLYELQGQKQTQAVKKEVQEVEEQLAELQVQDDELIEGKDYARLVKHMQRLEAKIDKSAQQSVQTTTELRIKRDYPDFETVASYDNLRKLRELDSDLADAILNTKDQYKQAALAYKMVKQMGIYQVDNYGPDREKAVANSNKPKPLAAIAPQQGESPLSHANAFANGLTEELKTKLRREMYEAMKNL